MPPCTSSQTRQDIRAEARLRGAQCRRPRTRVPLAGVLGANSVYTHTIALENRGMTRVEALTLSSGHCTHDGFAILLDLRPQVSWHQREVKPGMPALVRSHSLGVIPPSPCPLPQTVEMRSDVYARVLPWKRTIYLPRPPRTGFSPTPTMTLVYQFDLT
jgi:hypothetical protein